MTKAVCGVCALELSNTYLGVSRKKFDGETAEMFRQFAVEHYKKTNQESHA